MLFQSFWQSFSYLQSNKTDELIKKQGVTIEEFLEDESVLNEIKQIPQKFSDYIIKNPDKLKQLIDFCIKEQSITSEDGSDFNKCLKYPFVASEIFGAAHPNLASFLFGEYEVSQDDKEKDSKNNKKEGSINSSPKENGEKKQKKGGDDKGSNGNKQDSDEDHDSGEEDDNKKNEEESDDIISLEKEPSPTYTGPELLRHLFTFLERDDQYDHFSTSSGYFCKIVNNLINRDCSLWKYLTENPVVKENFLKHVDNKSIAETIYQLLVTDGSSNSYNDSEDKHGEQAENYMEQRKKIINELFVIYDQTDESEKLENLSYIISEVVSQSSNSKLLLQLGEQVYEPENIRILLNKLKTNKDSFVIQYTASILNSLVQMFASNRHYSGDNSGGDEDDVQTDENNHFQLQFEALADKIQCLIEVVKSESGEGLITTSYGQSIKPFGFGRLKVIEIFSNILKCKSPSLYQTLIQTDFYSLIFTLFKEHPWNNLLHNLVEKIFTATLESEDGELIKCMLEQANIINLIVSGSPNNDEESEVQPHRCTPGTFKNKISSGTFAYLTRFANLILQQIEQNNEYVISYFQNNDTWMAYTENSLKKTNSIEKDLQLGGPTHGNDNDSDSDQKDDLDVDIQRIYEKFHEYFSSGTADKPKEADEEIHDETEDNKEFEDIQTHTISSENSKEYNEEREQAKESLENKQQVQQLFEQPQESKEDVEEVVVDAPLDEPIVYKQEEEEKVVLQQEKDEQKQQQILEEKDQQPSAALQEQTIDNNWIKNEVESIGNFNYASFWKKQ